MKLHRLIVAIALVIATHASAQGIEENPTACWGRDCSAANRVSAHKGPWEANCYTIDDSSIRYDLGLGGCEGILSGSSRMDLSFGNVPGTDTDGTSLYSLQEIKDTIATYGPTIRLSATFTGSYEACPSMDSWIGIGIATQESIVLSCGGPLYTIGFPINAKVGDFVGQFSTDFVTGEQLPYKYMDLTKCTHGLRVSYSTTGICKMDVNLLEISFQKK
jgi:hypothetical protein